MNLVCAQLVVKMGKPRLTIGEIDQQVNMIGGTRMREFKVRRMSSRSWAITDRTGYYLHSDGQLYYFCSEHWPTREQAQAVLDKFNSKGTKVEKELTMGVKLRKEEQRPGICMHDMKDGDIGEIVSWDHKFYIGRIVQRCGQYLISVGLSSGNGWGEVFNTPRKENRRVRILEPGEVLEIV